MCAAVSLRIFVNGITVSRSEPCVNFGAGGAECCAGCGAGAATFGASTTGAGYATGAVATGVTTTGAGAGATTGATFCGADPFLSM